MRYLEHINFILYEFTKFRKHTYIVYYPLMLFLHSCNIRNTHSIVSYRKDKLEFMCLMWLCRRTNIVNNFDSMIICEKILLEMLQLQLINVSSLIVFSRSSFTNATISNTCTQHIVNVNKKCNSKGQPTTDGNNCDLWLNNICRLEKGEG